jgi:hypothetical protein
MKVLATPLAARMTYSSILKMEAVRSFETPVKYQTTWPHMSQNSSLLFQDILYGKISQLREKMLARMQEIFCVDEF